MRQQKDVCDAVCMECKEAIFNPICPQCLSEEMLSWIEVKQDLELKKKLKIALQEVLNLCKIAKIKSEWCITCREKTAFLCPYCFTALVYEKLKEMRLGNELIKEFIETFNYDFEHTGYSREIYDE